jgi:hypothetical protein
MENLPIIDIKMDVREAEDEILLHLHNKQGRVTSFHMKRSVVEQMVSQVTKLLESLSPRAKS